MELDQNRLAEDLSGALSGEFLSDPLTRAMYSTDASLYQIMPLGVAFPADRDDLVTLAKYSSETETPLIPRGAGSGVAGSALGTGIIVDFSRFMRSMQWVSDDLVEVQPGIVRDQLNAFLRKRGRYFAPDPSNSAVTTVGSMLAIDAAGSRCFRVGSTRDHVRSIEVVLANGDCLEADRATLDFGLPPEGTIGTSGLQLAAGTQPVVKTHSEETRRRIVSRLAQLFRDNEGIIEDRQPPLVRNCCGYNVRGVMWKDELNLPRLLVGSEGTLGMFSSAVLHTMPIPEFRGAAVLLFGSLDDALKAVQLIRPSQPSACDLLDRRLLSLGRDADVRFAELISPAAEAALIVEQTGYSRRDVRERLRMSLEPVKRELSESVVACEAYEYDDVEFVWSLPSRVVPLLARLKGPSRPLPLIEDIAVPPELISDFLTRAQRVFQKHEVTASLYAHAASGQLHLRPFLPQPREDDGPKLEAIARDVYQVVFQVGGSISGEHGDGLARTAFIRSQYGPLYRVFQEIKEIFDPHHLLNPNKIISDDPHLTMRNLRRHTEPQGDLTELQLQWKPVDVSESVDRCNGCAVCRTQDAEGRMCPFFRLEPREAASPRSKANVLREMLSAGISPDVVTQPELLELSHLCFNCKQCQLECPSNVNIPQIAIEARASHVAANGLERADWILSRAHSLGGIGCTMSPLVNWMMANRSMRWLLEKALGIARERKLPQFARKSFLYSIGRAAKKKRATVGADGVNGESAKRTVAYFVDHFANFHDTELAQAFIAVMRHNGVSTLVPATQKASGMAMISAGDLDEARLLAEENVRELAEIAREGIPIVCTEPAAALCLTQEYPQLLDDPDVELVASQVVEAGHYLKSLHDQGQLLTDFSPLDFDVAYHTPCHLKALRNDRPLLELMSLIPQLRVHSIEKGCSGMAGAFGFARQHFEASLEIGRELMDHVGSGQFNFGATECSGCRLQMQQSTEIPTIHPIKLLALSYGLMPEVARQLNRSSSPLVIS